MSSIEPPSFKDAASLLGAETAPDASRTIMGFDWQRWLTVEAWLGLTRAQGLWIEWAEDFTIVGSDGQATAIQAKMVRRPLTLADRRIRVLVSRAFERPPEIATHIWATSPIGSEKDLGSAEPGIRLWQQSPDARVARILRTYLGTPGRLSPTARAAVLDGGLDNFRKLLGRVKWVVSQPELAGLRERVLRATATRLDKLGIRGAELITESSAALLFEMTARIATNERGRRRLTADELDDILLCYRRDIDDRSAKLLPVKPGVQTIPLRRRGSEVRNLVPFSSAWLNYSTSAIPMIGREAELETLLDFANSSEAFSWWALGGPAGVGKSRLAFEFTSLLQEDWEKGFAEFGDLYAIESHISVLTNNFSVVVDYASLDPQAVGRFLGACHRIARSGRRIRVLLLDRDVSDSAGWLHDLATTGSTLESILASSRHRPPLLLQTLLKRERELVSSWLEAAGLVPGRFLPKKNAPVWHAIRRATDSRPLYLGFAAAALARGESRFGTIADLLSPVLERESVRWRSIETSDESLEETSQIMAVAATMQGLPLLWGNDPIPIKVDGKILMIQTRDNPEPCLPTLAQALLIPEAKEQATRIFDGLMHRLAAALPVTESPVFMRRLARIRAMTGEDWRPRPDIVSEYFLAVHWQYRLLPAHLQSKVPQASDAALCQELQGSWKLRPRATIFTLNALRQHSWANESFKRAAIALSDEVLRIGSLEEKNIEGLTALLFDATIRIGNQQPTLAAIAPFVGRLQQIADAMPESESSAYRLWKAQKHLRSFEKDGEIRTQWTDILFRDAIRFFGQSPTSDYEADPFEHHALEVASSKFRALSPRKYAECANIVTFVSKLVEKSKCPEDREAELLEDVSSLYRIVSRYIDCREGLAADESQKRADLAKSLSTAIAELIAVLEKLTVSAREHLASALTALSIFHSERGGGDSVEKLYGHFRIVVDATPTLKIPEDEVQILLSTQEQAVARNDRGRAWELTSRAREVVRKEDAEQATAFARMLRNGSRFPPGVCASADWLPYVTMLCEFPWETKDKTFRDYLLETFTFISVLVGKSGDEELMKAIARVLEPTMDTEPYRTQLRDYFGRVPSFLGDTEEESQNLTKAMFYYANAAIDAKFLSMDLENRLASQLGHLHYAYNGRISDDIRKLWPFKIEPSDEGVNVYLEKTNYFGLVSCLPLVAPEAEVRPDLRGGRMLRIGPRKSK